MTLTTQNGDYNLYASGLILNQTATIPAEYEFEIKVGDGTKNLQASGSMLMLLATIANQNYGPETFAKDTPYTRIGKRTNRFYVASGEIAQLYLVSSHIYDTDVDVTVNPRVVQTNVVQVGGNAQSATDLKDFADAGYDPSTHKVQGVVLTDTATTLTGHTVQTGDSYAIVAHADYGNAKLVRSVTPENGLAVDASGNAYANAQLIEGDPAQQAIADSLGLTPSGEAAAGSLISNQNIILSDYQQRGQPVTLPTGIGSGEIELVNGYVKTKLNYAI